MKRLLAAIFQFLLFFVIDVAGSFAGPFHLREVLSVSTDGTRVFVWDGALLMIATLVVILLIEQLRHRLPATAPWTLGAFVLAAAAGLALKLGFLTV